MDNKIIVQKLRTLCDSKDVTAAATCMQTSELPPESGCVQMGLRTHALDVDVNGSLANVFVCQLQTRAICLSGMHTNETRSGSALVQT